jgi:DNA-binding NtrC family response regulator
MVVFSSDRDILELVEKALPASWHLERVQKTAVGREILSRPNIQLVIVDDESVPEDSKGWLLDHIRRFAPRALLIYVAASHSPDEEKRARAYAAQYYTAKPLDPDRTLRVLQSFLHALAERDAGRPGDASADEPQPR